MTEMSVLTSFMATMSVIVASGAIQAIVFRRADDRASERLKRQINALHMETTRYLKESATRQEALRAEGQRLFGQLGAAVARIGEIVDTPEDKEGS